MNFENFIEEITHNTGRTFIVGDVHGEFDQLMHLLDQVGFDYDNDLCLAVGDLVDRGNRSLDCFNLLSKSWFKSVRGNHEEFCCQYFECVDADSTLEHINFHVRHGGEWFYKLPLDVRKHITNCFMKMPVAIVLEKGGEKHLIVHGDIPEFINDIDELYDMVHGDMACDSVSRIMVNGRRVAKGLYYMSPDITPFGGVKMVYLGHTPVKNVVSRLNYTMLDTGALTGNISLLEIT